MSLSNGSGVALCDAAAEATGVQRGGHPAACEVRRKVLRYAWIDLIEREIGEPHYAFTLTLKPMTRPGCTWTRIADAEQTMDWFLHVLNIRCFGHGHRRKGFEVGIAATLEGLGLGEQPHWHGVIRLPKLLRHDKFQEAFRAARRKTRRIGRQHDLQPYYGEGRWLSYILKTGGECVAPRFLRRCHP